MISFKQLIAYLSKANIPYGVFGGMAIRAFEPLRDTHDIDVLTIDTSLAQIASGCKTEVVQDKYQQDIVTMNDIEIYGTLNIHTPVGKCVFQMDEKMIERLIRVSIDNITLNVLSHEDHIVLKAILQRGYTRKKQDEDDIRILASQGNLDIVYLMDRIRATHSLGWADKFLIQMGIINNTGVHNDGV